MTFMEQVSYINEVIRELKNINESLSDVKESLAILVKNQSCPPPKSLCILPKEDALNNEIRRGRETLASTQPNTVTTIRVTLSPAMPNVNYSVCATVNGSSVGLCCVGDISTTGFNIFVRNIGTGAMSGNVEWIVIA